MDKEVQDRLIEKCKRIVESEYRLEVPIRMADIHDSMIIQGIPFNILYKAYHVQEGNYMFYDHSELLTQVLYTFLTGVKLAYHRNSQQMIEHMEEKINRRCYRVNKETGCIDVYEYDYGVMLFERRKRNES